MAPQGQLGPPCAVLLLVRFAVFYRGAADIPPETRCPECGYISWGDTQFLRPEGAKRMRTFDLLFLPFVCCLLLALGHLGYVGEAYCAMYPLVIFGGVLFVIGLRKPKPPPRGYCKRCGYSLIGNISGVCPECGTKMGELA